MYSYNINKEEDIKYYRSKFYSLYKDIKNEIREKVISKLEITVEKLHKELTLLRQENISLKNHLSYILKRLILNKNQYNNNNSDSKSRNNNNNNISKTLKNINNYFNITSSNLINKSSFRTGSLESHKFTTADEDIFNTSNRKFKKTLNKTIDVNEFMNESNPTIVDKKIKGYLNAMYRNNFLTNNSGLTNNLNKSETILKELFPSTNKKIYKTITHNDDHLSGRKPQNLTYRNTSKLAMIKDWDRKHAKKHKNNSIRMVKSIKPKKKRTFKIKDYNEEIIKDDIFHIFDSKSKRGSENLSTRNYNTSVKNKDSNYRLKNQSNNYGDKIKAKKGLLFM
jgi:hypothetical protein